MRAIAIAVSVVLGAAATGAAEQATIGAPTLAPVTIAFFNPQRVIAESAEGKAAAAKLQALNKQKVSEYQEKTKALEAAQQKLEKISADVNETERLKTVRELERLKIELERFKQDATSELQTLQHQLFQPVEDKIRPIFDAIIKERGIRIVFNVAEARTFLVDPRMDITQEVISRLDATAAQPAKPVPPPSNP